MIETYKYLTNIYNTENPWLILEADSNTRGHSLKLTKQRSMTELRRHCFSNRIVNYWNSLSDHVVAAETLNAFKARLDKLWKNRMYEVDTWGHKKNGKEEFSDCRRHIAADDHIFIHVTQTGFLGGTLQLNKNLSVNPWCPKNSSSKSSHTPADDDHRHVSS